MCLLTSSSIMPRTTLDLDLTVLRDLRRRARRDRKSMGQLASELLAEPLAQQKSPPSRFRWRSAKLGEPVVDLEDKEALQALLDEEA